MSTTMYDFLDRKNVFFFVENIYLDNPLTYRSERAKILYLVHQSRRLGMIYCDHSLSVCPSINTFEQLLWNPRTNFLQISCGTFCQGDWKFVQMVMVHLELKTAMLIYSKNTYKSSPEPRKLWGWILVHVYKIGDPRLAFDLFTARSNFASLWICFRKILRNRFLKMY